jgi:hypothetical protein
MTHISNRGLPLVYSGMPCDVPVITVENYMKWYELHLVNPDYSVTVFDHIAYHYHELSREFSGVTLVGDHMWNPSYVMELAIRTGYILCNESIEMITGRWVRDHLDDGKLVLALSERKDLRRG